MDTIAFGWSIHTHVLLEASILFHDASFGTLWAEVIGTWAELTSIFHTPHGNLYTIEETHLSMRVYLVLSCLASESRAKKWIMTNAGIH